jgi:hypothetical protein
MIYGYPNQVVHTVPFPWSPCLSSHGPSPSDGRVCPPCTFGFFAFCIYRDSNQFDFSSSAPELSRNQRSLPSRYQNEENERAIGETREHTCAVLRHSPDCAAALCERLVEWTRLDPHYLDYDIYWVRHQLFEHILMYPLNRPQGTYVIQGGPGFRKSDKRGCRGSLNARALTEKGVRGILNIGCQSYSRVGRREIDGQVSRHNERA